jgi:hypothetical protein
MRPKTKTRAKARRYRKTLKSKDLEALAELPGEDHLRQMVDAALSVARERQQLLEQIREAVEENNVDELVPLVRRYCGLTRSLKVVR